MGSSPMLPRSVPKQPLSRYVGILGPRSALSMGRSQTRKAVALNTVILWAQTPYKGWMWPFNIFWLPQVVTENLVRRFPFSPPWGQQLGLAAAGLPALTAPVGSRAHQWEHSFGDSQKRSRDELLKSLICLCEQMGPQNFEIFNFIYLFFSFYCYSVTIVCIFSPSLHWDF